MKETPTAYYREGDDPKYVARCKELNMDTISRSAGYRSIHFVVYVPILTSKLKCEIQVRTVFEEAWSEIDHIVRYPSDTGNELLNSYLLIFNRLAGCADEMGTFLMAMKANMAQMQHDKEILLNEIESLRGKNAKQNEKIDELKAKLDKSMYWWGPYVQENPYKSTLDYIESIQAPSGSTVGTNPYISLLEDVDKLLHRNPLEEFLAKDNSGKTSFRMPKAGIWSTDMKDYPWGKSLKDKK